ncbi:UDP-N-acetylmuramoyl-tripeptide--D-alanyl-D-alanine ligase [Endozoicomonadaceae bacterium StTr2]
MLADVTLEKLKGVLEAEFSGEDATVSGISTDTRTIQPGNLYVALVGPNFDGHNFAEQAQKSGAVAAVVSRKLDIALPQLVVADTRIAYGRIGAWNRDRFDGPVVGITGSSGKTSVKEMVAAILAQSGAVLATEANLNNDIGTPLTLSRINDEHNFAVVELGTNAPGEIAYIANLARPDVAIINNASVAHLEKLGSVEGVAKEKGDLLDGLKDSGVAVLNRDDRFFDEWRTRALSRPSRTVKSFSLNDVRADARASDISFTAEGMKFRLWLEEKNIDITLPLLGKHQVSNALAAALVTASLGSTLEQIAAGLASIQPVRRRGRRYPLQGGGVLIDDSYNANPASTLAAIDVLAQMPAPRMLIVGDMRELATESESGHRQVGAHAAAAGIEKMLTLGELTRFSSDAYGQGAESFADHDSLISRAKELQGGMSTVLVKGSLSMQMNKIVEAMVGPAYAEKD